MLKIDKNASNEVKKIYDHIILRTLNDEELRIKISNTEKTMDDCMKYIYSEAKKIAKNGRAFVDDQVVFGWAIHFFDEDKPKAKPIKIEPAKKKRKKAKGNEIEQTSLF